MTYWLLESGKPLVLGDELARGGEGAIFSIVDDDETVAKIFLKELDQEKETKLRIMSSTASNAISQVAAWPTNLIAQSGYVCGFVMPRIAACDVRQLYSPKTRAQFFPDVDFRFIVHVAANISQAFATIHAAGYVIGDIDHKGILIGKDGRVILVGADSFQFKCDGHTYFSNVGSPLLTPPELQGQVACELARNMNHDLFGLAAILFHLLFMGRHPFCGVWLGAGEMTIERAIAERRFAYSNNVAATQMRRPPATLGLGAFGQPIAHLFEQALISTPGSWRPFAADWLREFQSLKASLKLCTKSTEHYFPSHLVTCPWCAIEQSGVRPFRQKLKHIDIRKEDVAAVWTSIARIQRPTSDPPLPSEQQWTIPPDAVLPFRYSKVLKKLGSVVLAGLAIAALAAHGGLAIALAVLTGAYFAWPRLSEKQKLALEAAVGSARREWEQILGRWNREARLGPFDVLKQDLRKTRAAFEDLPNERRKRMEGLRAEQGNYQLRAFLDRFTIYEAGLSQNKAATLASFGIETAFDVEEENILAIPGFGPTLANELLAWRREKERSFVYDADTPVAPSEIARVDSEILALHKNYIEMLTQGAARLAHLNREIPAARERLGEPLVGAWNALRLAEIRRERT